MPKRLMSGNQFQRDLFGEFEKPQNRSKRIHDILPRTVSIRIPLERLVFICIAIMMALVVVFAAGVERGRARKAKTQETLVPDAALVEPVLPIVVQKQLKMPVVVKPPQDPAPSIRPSAEEARFTIQAVTFRKKDDAEASVGELSGDGFEAFIVPSGGYFQVRVGRYPDKGSAQKDLKRIRKQFSDCYIRKL